MSKSNEENAFEKMVLEMVHDPKSDSRLLTTTEKEPDLPLHVYNLTKNVYYENKLMMQKKEIKENQINTMALFVFVRLCQNQCTNREPGSPLSKRHVWEILRYEYLGFQKTEFEKIVLEMANDPKSDSCFLTTIEKEPDLPLHVYNLTKKVYRENIPRMLENGIQKDQIEKIAFSLFVRLCKNPISDRSPGDGISHWYVWDVIRDEYLGFSRGKFAHDNQVLLSYDVLSQEYACEFLKNAPKTPHNQKVKIKLADWKTPRDYAIEQEFLQKDRKPIRKIFALIEKIVALDYYLARYRNRKKDSLDDNWHERFGCFISCENVNNKVQEFETKKLTQNAAYKAKSRSLNALRTLLFLIPFLLFVSFFSTIMPVDNTISLNHAESQAGDSRQLSLVAASEQAGDSRQSSLVAASKQAGDSRQSNLVAASKQAGDSRQSNLVAASKQAGDSRQSSLVAASEQAGDSRQSNLVAASKQAGDSRQSSLVAASKQAGDSRQSNLVAASEQAGDSRQSNLVAASEQAGDSRQSSLVAASKQAGDGRQSNLVSASKQAGDSRQSNLI